MKKILNIAITGAEDLPIPAVHGGAVEVLVEELVKGNEKDYRFNIDLYTVSDPLLDDIHYEHCNIIQMYPEELAKFPDEFDKKTSQLGLAIREKMKEKKYDFILVEHSMRVFNSIKDLDNLIYHLHCDIDDERYRPKWIAKEIIEKTYCTISVSKFAADAFNKIEFSEKNKVLYNCIDLDIFNPENVNKAYVEEFKKKHNITENDYTFLYSGRVCLKKGILQLVNAFKLLRAKRENVKLVIIGKENFAKNDQSEFSQKLKELTDELKDDIIFTGFINHDDVPSSLELGDCVVIPTMVEEAFGVVALEAMAMKRATISTISGGLPEPLSDKCALFVEKDENVVKNLCDAMEKMASDRDLTRKMGEEGYKRVHSVEEFDSKKYFENFCKVIELDKFE